MKKRFTEEQIVGILREGQAGGKSVEQLCRDHGISPATYYLWKRKYGRDVKRDSGCVSCQAFFARHGGLQG